MIDDETPYTLRIRELETLVQKLRVQLSDERIRALTAEGKVEKIWAIASEGIFRNE